MGRALDRLTRKVADRPIDIEALRFEGEEQVFHIYAIWNEWTAFDHSGWNPEPQLVAVNTDFEGHRLERVAITGDLAAFCEHYYHRMPHHYWRDPMQRARDYLGRHQPPWAERFVRQHSHRHERTLASGPPRCYEVAIKRYCARKRSSL